MSGVHDPQSTPLNEVHQLYQAHSMPTTIKLRSVTGVLPISQGDVLHDTHVQNVLRSLLISIELWNLTQLRLKILSVKLFILNPKYLALLSHKSNNKSGKRRPSVWRWDVLTRPRPWFCLSCQHVWATWTPLCDEEDVLPRPGHLCYVQSPLSGQLPHSLDWKDHPQSVPKEEKRLKCSFISSEKHYFTFH